MFERGSEMKKLLCIFAAAITFLFTGCASEPAKRSFFAMDTYITVTAYGDNAENAVKDAEQFVLSLEKLWSVTDPESEISKINTANGKAVKVSEKTAEVISFSKNMNACTGGSLDISVYPLVKEWGFTGDSFHVPAQEKISELLNHVDAQSISVSGTTVTLKKDMMIDLGAVAKGYACDLLAGQIKNSGVTSAIIDLGGNIRTVGTKTDGSLWKVGLRSPESDDLFGTLTLGEGAVATSGGYERYFEADGKRYCHIIDPATGYPAESGLLSVSVISPEGKLSDALSTALFVCGADKARELWKNLGGFDYIAVTDKHEVLVTSGAADAFELDVSCSDWKVTVIV